VAVVDGFKRTAAEAAAAMNLSPMTASYLLSHAEALHTRLHQGGRAAGRRANRLAHGALDYQPRRSDHR
jgi:hypothetical protein